jgi:hypothetical protein
MSSAWEARDVSFTRAALLRKSRRLEATLRESAAQLRADHGEKRQNENGHDHGNGDHLGQLTRVGQSSFGACRGLRWARYTFQRRGAVSPNG